LNSAAIDAACGASVWFKCENLQHIGAFKFRGASNAVWSLSDAEAGRGVLTHSSGNHGAALGLAARMRGIPAHVVVPENAPAIKIANMRETGALLHFCAPNLAARESLAAQVQADTGAEMVHPFTHSKVIAGQGTAVLELLAEQPDLDTVVVPVGGGGLLSGTAIAAHSIRSSIDIYAAEPEGAADAFRAMQTGQREANPQADTICDGLRTGIGAINFAIMQHEAVRVLTASDIETIAAMRLLWDRLKLIVEPSAAVCLASMLRHADAIRGRRVGVILSGGNVDLDALPWRL
jgi:threonine dehydratase